MNTLDIDRVTRKLVDELIEYTRREIAAAAEENTPAVNRNVDQATRRLRLLKATDQGRAALELLLSHDLAEIRLTAAHSVLGWAPGKAIPVLGRLVAEWKPGNPKRGYIPVAFDAAVSLYEYWGIRSYNRDDLIEPLARYGIKLEQRR